MALYYSLFVVNSRLIHTAGNFYYRRIEAGMNPDQENYQ